MSQKSTTKRIYVLIRYSIVSRVNKSWVVSKLDDFEQYKNSIFDQHRMNVHEILFDDVAIPSLVSLQENTPDAEVFVYVFTSELLPEGNKQRLKEILSKVKNSSIFEVDIDEDFVGRMRTEVRNDLLTSGLNQVIYSTIRFDDDDALSKNFGPQLYSYMKDEFCGFGVSFARGYVGYYENSEFIGFFAKSAPLNAQGISYIAKYNSSNPETVQTIFDLGAHTTIDQRRPVILDSKNISYIYTIHAESDVAQRIENRMTPQRQLVGADKVRPLFASTIRCSI